MVQDRGSKSKGREKKEARCCVCTCRSDLSQSPQLALRNTQGEVKAGGVKALSAPFIRVAMPAAATQGPVPIAVQRP